MARISWVLWNGCTVCEACSLAVGPVLGAAARNAEMLYQWVWMWSCSTLIPHRRSIFHTINLHSCWSCFFRETSLRGNSGRRSRNSRAVCQWWDCAVMLVCMQSSTYKYKGVTTGSCYFLNSKDYRHRKLLSSKESEGWEVFAKAALQESQDTHAFIPWQLCLGLLLLVCSGKSKSLTCVLCIKKKDWSLSLLIQISSGCPGASGVCPVLPIFT